MGKHILSAAIAALAFGSQTLAQGGAPNFTEYFQIPTFPKAQQENVSTLLSEAFEISSPDLVDLMTYRCILVQRYKEVQQGVGIDGFIKPTQVYDGLYYIGQNAVSAWLIDTGEGLIVIDALNNAEEAQRILVPGIEAFGYKPEDVKALFVTHEHFDRYGGSLYLQSTYGTPIYANEIAWKGIEEGPAGGPKRDQIVVEGEPFQLGNLTINFIATPGHSVGPMSMILNVADHGQEFFAAVNGGAGTARNITAREEQIRSNAKLADAIQEYNVSVLLANHPSQDRTIANLDILEARICDDSGCETPNPFNVGVDGYSRYLQTMSRCVALQSARDGINMNVSPEEEHNYLIRRALDEVHEHECEH